MSAKWLYILVVLGFATYLRIKSYKSSVRLEKKLDLILKTLGAEPEEEPVKAEEEPAAGGRKAKVLKFLRPRKKAALLEAKTAAKSAEKR